MRLKDKVQYIIEIKPYFSICLLSNKFGEKAKKSFFPNCLLTFSVLALGMEGGQWDFDGYLYTAPVA